MELSVRQVVRRRRAERFLQLPRSPSDRPRRNKAALIWEGEPGDSRMLTYQMLAARSARCANVLKQLGVKAGDRVAIYMPMVPEAAIAMLACARIGATHSVVFGGFSADALRDRINDAEAKVVYHRRRRLAPGPVVDLKRNVDEALAQTPLDREMHRACAAPASPSRCSAGRDVWWDELVADAERRSASRARSTPSIRCSSSTPRGTTGKPKGVVHTTGGYLLHT